MTWVVGLLCTLHWGLRSSRPAKFTAALTELLKLFVKLRLGDLWNALFCFSGVFLKQIWTLLKYLVGLIFIFFLGFLLCISKNNMLSLKIPLFVCLKWCSYVHEVFFRPTMAQGETTETRDKSGTVCFGYLFAFLKELVFPV